MAEISYSDALNQAYRTALEEYDDSFIMGEDIRQALTGSTKGLADDFDDRVFDMPMSENGFTGLGAGAAMDGGRPIIEYQVNTLPYLVLDQIANSSQKYRMMSGGRINVPLTMTVMGAGVSGGSAAQHSDNIYPLLMHTGVKTVVPTNPYDAKGLFRTAVAEDDPVIVFFPGQLLGQQGEVPEEPYSVPFGEAEVRRQGEDVTVVAIGDVIRPVEAVAEDLAGEVDVEIVDPRTLVPLDEETIFESVRKTNRVVVVESANRTCGAAAEIAARISNVCIWSLDAPVKRVTRADSPVSYSPPQEQYVLPDEETVRRAIDDVMW